MRTEVCMMCKTLSKIILLIMVIVGIAVVSVWADRSMTSMAIRKNHWFKCCINMNVIQHKVAQALSDHPEWASDISIPFLVSKGYLPEWSEIYICPDDFGIDFSGTRMIDNNYIDHPDTASLIGANYNNSSYFIEVRNYVVTIKCRYHADVSDYSISIPCVGPAWVSKGGKAKATATKSGEGKGDSHQVW